MCPCKTSAFLSHFSQDCRGRGILGLHFNSSILLNIPNALIHNLVQDLGKRNLLATRDSDTNTCSSFAYTFKRLFLPLVCPKIVCIIKLFEWNESFSRLKFISTTSSMFWIRKLSIILTLYGPIFFRRFPGHNLRYPFFYQFNGNYSYRIAATIVIV